MGSPVFKQDQLTTYPQTLKNWLFKSVQKQVFTTKAKVVFFFICTVMWVMMWIFRAELLKMTVNPYLVSELSTSIPQGLPLVVENWSGESELFFQANLLQNKLKSDSVFVTMYQSVMNHPRKRTAMMMNMWAAELDTSNVQLIPIPFQEPKTLMISNAVVECAKQKGWSSFVLLTNDLHSRRSQKCYEKYAKPYGITVYVHFYEREIHRNNWFMSITGFTAAFPEVVKQLYYDMFVL